MAYTPTLGKWLFGGTSAGSKYLAEYDLTTVTDLSTSIPQIPRCIITDGSKWWIAGDSGMLYSYDGSTFTDRSTTVDFGTEQIRALAWDGTFLWLGGASGTCKRYNPSTGAVDDYTTTFGFSEIWNLAYNPSNGQLIIIGVKAGSPAIYSWDGSTLTDRTSTVGISTPTALTVDSDGYMYFGGSAGEVKYASPTWTVADISDRFGITSKVTALLVTTAKELADDWVTMASMPTARYLLTSSAVNNIIYVIGGWIDDTCVGTNEAYDPSTDTWSTKTSMPTARESLTSSAVNNIIYVIGGDFSNETFEVLDINEAYFP